MSIVRIPKKSLIKPRVHWPALRRDLSLSRGLVGYWPLWEGAGDTARDVAGLNNGAINGATWGGSVAGPVISLNGSDQYGLIEASAAIDDLGPMSIAVRVRSTRNNTTERILAKRGTGGSSSGWVLYKASFAPGAVVFEIDFTTTDMRRRTANGVVGADTDRFDDIVVTWDGSSAYQNIHIYINGVELSYAVETDGVGDRVSDAGDDLFIGQLGNSGGFFLGDFDTLAIYDRVIGDAEIKALADDPYRLITPRRTIAYSIPAVTPTLPPLLDSNMLAGGFQTISGGL